MDMWYRELGTQLCVGPLCLFRLIYGSESLLCFHATEIRSFLNRSSLVELCSLSSRRLCRVTLCLGLEFRVSLVGQYPL